MTTSLKDYGTLKNEWVRAINYSWDELDESSAAYLVTYSIQLKIYIFILIYAIDQKISQELSRPYKSLN